MSAGQGSAGTVIAAVQFVLAAVLWLILLGWVIHLWSVIDAAMFEPPRRYYA